jgi:hypothetical protein
MRSWSIAVPGQPFCDHRSLAAGYTANWESVRTGRPRIWSRGTQVWGSDLAMTAREPFRPSGGS